MNYYALLPFTAFLSNFFIGTYVLAQDRKSRVNRAFLIFILAFGGWSLAKTFIWAHIHAGPPDLISYKLQSLFWLPTGIVIINLTYALLRRERKVIFFASLVTTILLMILSLLTDYITVGGKEAFWGYIEVPGLLFLPVTVVLFSQIIYSIVLICFEIVRTKNPDYRKQLHLFVIGLTLTTIISLITEIILPGIFHKEFPELGPTSTIAITVMTFIAINKYHFLTARMEQVAEALFNDMQDGAILMDERGSVILMNSSARSFFASKINNFRQSVITDLIPEYNPYDSFQNYETTITFPAGTKFVLLSDTSFKFRSGHRGKLLFIRDITEFNAIREEMVRNQKLETVGLLAGGIAHDFNNILTVIHGNISFAEELVGDNEELRDILEKVTKSAERAAGLTGQLLTFAKGGAPVKILTDMEKLIRECSAFTISGSNVSIQYEIAQDFWAAEVDQGQIHQVLHNVVINATQAMPDGGEININAGNTILEPGEIFTLRGGNYLKIAIEDHGHGIDKEIIPNIFDPYFTTKQKSSGLGLTTCFSIIKKHNGAITVDSIKGRGTVFNLYLPASEESPGEPLKKREQQRGTTGHILVVDDEEEIRQITGQMLINLEYQVSYAKDGQEALEIYMTTAPKIDIVILDLTIPGGMGGEETIKELLKLDPKVKAVVTSGYSNSKILSNFEEYGFIGVLPKPFSFSKLSEVIISAQRQQGQGL